MKRGFTVVEILITLAVMAVLLGLGVVSMRSVLANGRDSERKADIDAIARSLEAYYKTGNPTVLASTGRITKGTYPGSVEFAQMTGFDGCSDSWLTETFSPCSGVTLRRVLPSLSDAALSAPDIATGTRSLYVKGESGVTTQSEINSKLSQGYYIYTPTRADDPTQICYGMLDWPPLDVPCAAYTLSYKEEATGTIIKVKSRHN